MSLVGIETPLPLAAATIAAIVYTILAIACAIAESRFGWKRPRWVSAGLIAFVLIVFVCIGVWFTSVASATDYSSQQPCPTNPISKAYQGC